MSIYGWLIKLTDRLPEYIPLAYLGRRYADRCDGFSTIDPEFNGEYALTRRVLPRCSVVFDIGANVGHWTRHALQVNPKLAIHCFEPVEKNLTELRALANRDNIFVNPLAVGAVEENREIHLYASSGWHSLHERGLDVPADGVATQRVQVTTVDAYRKRAGVGHIDFIKIDVEGHELAVLQGMAETLADKQVEVVQFEYGAAYIDAGTKLRDAFNFLASHGYDLYKLYSRGPRRVPAFSFEMENYQYQNWVGVRRGSPLMT